jgi:hypothetical protein
MLNENIPYVHGIPPERIRAAAERARYAFYTSLARDFPNLKAGNLDPSEILAFESVSNDLAVVWLIYNSEHKG